MEVRKGKVLQLFVELKHRLNHAELKHLVWYLEDEIAKGEK